MSTAAAIFAATAPLPSAGPAVSGDAKDAQGEGAFADLLGAATSEAPTQPATGFLKPAPLGVAAEKGAQAAAVSLEIDAPVVEATDAVDALVVAKDAAPDTADASSDIETAPTEPAPDAEATPDVLQPLLAPPQAAPAPQPAVAVGAGPAEPAIPAPAPATLPSIAAGSVAAGEVPAAPAAETLTAQPAAVASTDVSTDKSTDTAAPPVPATKPETVVASTKAGEMALQAQVKGAPKIESETTEAPVAPARKAEAREDRSTAAASTPGGPTAPAVNDVSAPAASALTAQAKEATTDGSSAKAGAAASPDPTPLDAPTEAAPSPKADGQTAAAPAAAREAAQPQTTPAALASTLSRATVETTAQLSAHILRRLEGRSTHFDMVLTPEALGRVEVSVDIDADGQLAARLAFDNPAAALDLRGRVDELRRQLEDAGFRLTNDSLSFTDRDSGRSGDQRQDGAARRFASAARVANEADQTVSPVRWMSMNLTPDRVDVRV